MPILSASTELPVVGVEDKDNESGLDDISDSLSPSVPPFTFGANNKNK